MNLGNLNFNIVSDFDIRISNFRAQHGAHRVATAGVSPFGNHRIKGWLAPLRRYRCRQRPSSALTTKASTICFMAFKNAFFLLLLKIGSNFQGAKWSQPGLNRRPSRCKRDALPAEL